MKPKSIEYCISYMKDKPYFGNFVNNIVNENEYSSKVIGVSTPVMYFSWSKAPESDKYWYKINSTLLDAHIVINNSYEELKNYILSKYSINKYPEYYI